VVDFDIYSPATQRNHRGRIERIPAHELPWPACETDAGLVVGSHRLWVDGRFVAEYIRQTTPQSSFEVSAPPAGSGIERIDPFRFLAG